MRIVNHRQRGAALIETALALPVILIALYGITWAARVGTMSERAESAVRYAGVVSAQQNPYHDYSLNAVYNNVLTAPSNVQTLDCTAPTTLYLKGGSLPVVVPGTPQSQEVMPSFWLPDFTKPDCDRATAQRQYFAGGSRSYLLLQSVPRMLTQTTDGHYFNVTTQLGTNLTTEFKFYRSPDVATLMHCANGLGTAVTGSLTRSNSGAQIFPLAVSNFAVGPLAITPNCTTAMGIQPAQPPPSFPPFSGGQSPPPPPGPPPSPTAQPSPNPTQSATSPKPSTPPTPAVSPTPAASPTAGKGGGGSGGASPTPTPKPGGSASPAPPCCKPPGSPGPGASPSAAPVTPAPSKPPATPQPSSSPTTSPTKKPQPSPSPPGPPGGIS